MARFCPHCGSGLKPGAAAAVHSASLAAIIERRQLTAVFCDLVGSTELATKMDPEDFAAVIGRFHRCVRETMERYGGFFARPMGDGALVFFGYPQANEDDAERAVRASLATVEAMEVIDGEDGRRLHVKIGIATGIAIVGDVSQTGGLDAAGEALNLAARLQELAAPDTVLVADTVRQLIGPLFVYREFGMRALKGWKDPIEVSQVLRAVANPSRFEARTRHQLTPLIGRSTEVSKLKTLWRAAGDGAGSVVMLTGEPGIGKSRLAAQLMVETELETHARLRWFGIAHQHGVAFHPCVQQIKHATGIEDNDSPELRRAKLETVLGDASEEDFVLIASLMMAQVDGRSLVLQSSPQRRREQTLRALLNWLVRICHRHPVLAVFDDAHWCDPTTAELLSLVVRRVGSLPLLFVVTARPEFKPDWIDGETVEHIPLRPLGPGEGADLIRTMTGADALAQEVIDAIVTRCDGVPLFLEEVTKSVLEGSESTRGCRGAAPLGEGLVAVPPSIHASLLARLDRLGAVRPVAEAAAAIGRDFTVGLLQHVHEASNISLRAAIRRLVDAGLVLPSRPVGSARFHFKHTLIQDTAYGMMVRERRRGLHRRIAQALETHFPQTAATEPQLLARHCTEAGLIEQAVGWWLRAGTQSLQRAAPSEALAHLYRGLELCATLPDIEAQRRQELDLQIVLGKVIIATQGHAVPTARAAFARARALCEGLDASPQLLTVLFGQWTHALLRADLASAGRQAEELLALARKSHDRVWKLVACYAAGFTHFALGSFGSSHRFLRRGLKLFNPDRRAEYARPVVGDPRVLLRTYLAWERMCVGRSAEAWIACNAAVTEARALRHSYSLAHALSKQAYLQLYIGTPAAAFAVAEELQALADEHGIAFFEAAATFFRGWCRGLLGDPTEGLALVQKGAELYRGTGTLLHVPSFLRVEAELFGRSGQAGAGLARIADARAMLAESGERWEEAEIRRTEGELLHQAGQMASAEAVLADADRVATSQGADLFVLRTRISMAELLADQERRGEASTALTSVIERFDPACEIPDFLRARHLLATLR
jgi:class 3 adenylate cyclase/predicted ATPase